MVDAEPGARGGYAVTCAFIELTGDIASVLGCGPRDGRRRRPRSPITSVVAVVVMAVVYPTVMHACQVTLHMRCGAAVHLRQRGHGDGERGDDENDNGERPRRARNGHRPRTRRRCPFASVAPSF